MVAQVVAFQSKTAFTELVQRYQSPVRAYLRRLSKNHAIADDLAQDTFIKAWDKAHMFSGTGSFKAWLFKIAYNQFLQLVRKNKRERLNSLDAEESDAIEFAQAKPMNDETPDLHRFLQVLNKEERESMVLAYVHGMSHSEISDIINMPVGTIKSHIHRGKLKIQESFNLNDHILTKVG